MDDLNESTKVANLFQEVMVLFKQSMGKAFEDSGITALQSMVLRVISMEKKVKITELSSKLSLPNSTLSGILDRLERQEMVVRERSLEDRRVVYVSISPHFKDLHQKMHQNLKSNIEKVLKQGTQEDLNEIYRGLNTLKNLLRDSGKNNQ